MKFLFNIAAVFATLLVVGVAAMIFFQYLAQVMMLGIAICAGIGAVCWFGYRSEKNVPPD